MRYRQRKKNHKKWSNEIWRVLSIDMDHCEFCGKSVVWDKKFKSYNYTCNCETELNKEGYSND